MFKQSWNAKKKRKSPGWKHPVITEESGSSVVVTWPRIRGDPQWVGVQCDCDAAADSLAALVFITIDDLIQHWPSVLGRTDESWGRQEPAGSSCGRSSSRADVFTEKGRFAPVTLTWVWSPGISCWAASERAAADPPVSKWWCCWSSKKILRDSGPQGLARDPGTDNSFDRFYTFDWQKRDKKTNLPHKHRRTFIKRGGMSKLGGPCLRKTIDCL